jgi:hypothetical protein
MAVGFSEITQAVRSRNASLPDRVAAGPVAANLRSRDGFTTDRGKPVYANGSTALERLRRQLLFSPPFLLPLRLLSLSYAFGSSLPFFPGAFFLA